MQRRDFLASSAALALATTTTAARHASAAPVVDDPACCGPGYASPSEAAKAPPEKLLYVTALYVGTGVDAPDYLATVDVDPQSPTYSQVIHRTAMPTAGDELHHFGWNACSSCHGDANKRRQYLIVPGQRSGRIQIVDAGDPRAPKLHQVIEADEIQQKTGLSAPHTVHCLGDGTIVLSMLGDADGNAPGGFLQLDANFKILGRWENSLGAMKYNYDFWYQPRHNVMVSSEWGAPKTYQAGFKPDDVAAGKYGTQIHFWDFKAREPKQTINLGDQGQIPLEVRFLHNPDSDHGYVGAALSSALWHYHQDGDKWRAEKVVQVEPVALSDGTTLPGLITDLVVSMDDRYVYFSNWLHGDIRQYDISQPDRPRLVGQLWIGGLLGKAPPFRGTPLVGGPQMLQLSLDGRRLYVTSSLFSAWDDQFYPTLAKQGSFLLQIDCDLERGGMRLNDKFYVDFGKEPLGPARAHEMRYPGGDCTSDIWT